MDRFLNDILPQVPGCPGALVKNEVRRSAIEFCDDSWIWQDRSEYTVPADHDEITLAIPAGSAIAGVQMAVDKAGFNEYTRSGTTITLDHAGTDSTVFKVTVFLKPARDADSLPDFLYEDWFEAIESRAKYELMNMPGKKWFSPNLAVINQRKYLKHLGQAKIQARKTNDQTRLMVKQRFFV